MTDGAAVDYWVSTKSSPKILRPRWRNAVLDRYFAETAGIDPAILSIEVGISVPRINAYRRSLGLRPITGTARKGAAISTAEASR